MERFGRFLLGFVGVATLTLRIAVRPPFPMNDDVSMHTREDFLEHTGNIRERLLKTKNMLFETNATYAIEPKPNSVFFHQYSAKP
jgi:hypothetical protein